MKKIAIIGASGFVGSALYKKLKKKRDYESIGVDRGNYESFKKQSFDFVINTAMPSGRFWAKNNPQEDFKETVEKTANMIYNWQYEKFIHISTVSARSQLDTVYGRHKAAAEALIDTDKHLVVRLGPMFDETLQKGVLIDMLQGKTVYISGESKYCFTPLSFVTAWIASNLDRHGIIEVGAKNAIRLKVVARHLKKDIRFDGPIDNQEVMNPQKIYPDAKEVYRYLDAQRT